MVWCGIWNTRLIGPFFIHGNLNGYLYLDMLQELAFPSHLNPEPKYPAMFQIVGVIPYCALSVMEWLDAPFPGQCIIGRLGTIEWLVCSPDLKTFRILYVGPYQSTCLSKYIDL